MGSNTTLDNNVTFHTFNIASVDVTTNEKFKWTQFRNRKPKECIRIPEKLLTQF